MDDHDGFWTEMRKKYIAAFVLIGATAGAVVIVESVWFLIIKLIFS